MNLVELPDNDLQSIEIIDIGGAGSNALILDAHEVLNISSTTGELTVLSNLFDTVRIGDALDLTGATRQDGTYYRVLEEQVGQVTARLLLSGPANYQNPVDRHDVDNDGVISVVGDILRLINEINFPTVIDDQNRFPFEPDSDGLPMMMDVNGDGILSAQGDILGQINYFNDLVLSEGEGELDAGGISLVLHDSLLLDGGNGSAPDAQPSDETNAPIDQPTRVIGPRVLRQHPALSKRAVDRVLSEELEALLSEWDADAAIDALRFE